MLLLVPVLLSLLLLLAPVASAGHLSLSEASPLEFVFVDASVRELSGLTFDRNDPAGNRFYAVEDKESSLVPLTIDLDPVTGEILSATTGAKLQLSDPGGTPLPSSYDQEGVAFDAARGEIWVSNESEPGVRRHHLTTGLELDVALPGAGDEFDVFADRRGNLGFEALTAQPDGAVVWTANEEFLTGDPDPTVRLQRMDAELAPTGQWAYDVEPDPATFFSTTANGVSDILALADGTLVVMERAFGASVAGGIESRISLFEVDFVGTTPLAGGAITGATLRVGKILLYQRSFNLIQDNFEGIALGPALANGDLSVLLIADNASDTTGIDAHPLFALRLAIAPEPSAAALLLVGLATLSAARAIRLLTGGSGWPGCLRRRGP